MTKQLGLRQLISETIRDSCLDLFYTNSDIIAKAGVSDVNISDHQMIILTRKKAKVIKQKCEFTGRSYRNYNKDNFQDRIKNTNWEFLENEPDVNIQWQLFEENISTILDEMCPQKTFRIKQVKQPWITPRLLELILDKDKAVI